eukprot:CAMPEP_0202448364 /NCGR_PEP_ID=MMETSP1360-20130828/7174_1 /ASSEMBLY_ACC=CAM_ASM_000848 /TAXON_ID=515479 /ORGANISM="Licmophora paradoxa, Strain CCMP2313" /LENGTH=541 /DNA_ID=CAMNT_0049065893 /DNA_START=192 /DNA_END=1820 /DNA_ORIENTATION=-
MATNTDEALARALQNQYEQETISRTNVNTTSNQTSANSSRKSKKNKKDNEEKQKKKKRQGRKGRNRHQDDELVEIPVVPVDISSDKELAERLAMELQDEQVARQIERQQAEERRRNLTAPPSFDSQPPPLPAPTAPNNETKTQIKHEGSVCTAPTTGSRSSSFNSPSIHLPGDTFVDISDDIAAELDLELARKLDQEERDQALAYQINQRENARPIVQGQPLPIATTPRSTTKRCMSLMIPLVVILGVVVALAYLFGFNVSSGVPSLPGAGIPPIFQDPNPFDGLEGNENRWNNRDPGLTLEILDATDNTWTTQFNTAVDEWENGNPDVLTLVKTQVAVDSACKPVSGKLKVCNGNYGNTQWRGINQVLLSNGFIVSSVAKLNEYYLESSSDAQRQYTMCHEIGHGFGLSHTDENFNNRDLGDCMDYTSTPANNKSPNTRNFATLAELYGIPGASEDPQGRKLLRERLLTLPSDLWFRYDEALTENLDSRSTKEEAESDAPILKFPNRKVRKTGDALEKLIDLGGGYVLKLNMLMVEQSAY